MSQPELPAGDDADRPFIGSWPRIYLLVAASFVLWVVLLILLQRMYS
jgi:hypothetical protein